MLLGVVLLATLTPAQRPDRAFPTAVDSPEFTVDGPVVSFDRGHNNAHTLDRGYLAFARLLRADGYDLRQRSEPYTPESLAGTELLVVVNADGGTNPKLLGFNLPALRRGVRGSPAFGEHEVRALRDWVGEGGSLLLIADHAPFGTAAAGLAAALGVTMHGGFAELASADPGQSDPGNIDFTVENGRLARHAIVEGRGEVERIRRVRGFTGQSLDGPPGSELLLLPAGTLERIPRTREELATAPPDPPAGRAQAVAFELGKGRVVVCGEAAMLTAQIDDRGERFGMNVAGLDNRQFVLNVMHWLSRRI